MSPVDCCLRDLNTDHPVAYYSLAALEDAGVGHPSRLPYCLKIMLESLLRRQDHPAFQPEHVERFAAWTPAAEPREYPFLPARVLLQDFTGVPCIVDLAALRDGMRRAGRDPRRIEPEIPVDLIIDHSVQLDASGCPDAYATNIRIEMERNRERYTFLRWGQEAFSTLRVMPPGLGICHQINMELLATCITRGTRDGRPLAFPDSVVGTDSHTPMINSMGVVGWGVGGIEAEAAMLGQPIPILTPVVTGVRLTGIMRPGVTPTDVALTMVALLRERGVVGHFVEFFGPGLDQLSLADRAPLANMTPEYGATMGFFPVDQATLDYLSMTGRDAEHIAFVEAYCKAQGLFRDSNSDDIRLYSQVLEVDLGSVEPSLAGPKRPQDRVTLGQVHETFTDALCQPHSRRGFALETGQADVSVEVPGKGTLEHGAVVIASITSCTNTSNPALLLGAGILARKAVARGLTVPAWVKTSFAPGSRVAADYLARAGLTASLDALGFHISAYGCATCIGNSGPLAADVATAITQGNLVATAVLSGNRNFEGRIHPLTQANYLCSPLLVVAYALKGTMRGSITETPIATDPHGCPVYLHDLWPTPADIQRYLAIANDPHLYRKQYAHIEGSNPDWDALPADGSETYTWDTASTYIRNPPWLDNATDPAPAMEDLANAAILGIFGDFVTTDHISPAGTIAPDSPAADYLRTCGVQPEAFNSYGARRGNHEIMMRGTFANIRIRNLLVERAGGWTIHHPTGEEVTIFEAAGRYLRSRTPLVVLAGHMYGAGSSRDWAAKGPALLGVKVIVAQSYERIHRSNLVGMGILPLEFMPGENAEVLDLKGSERLAIEDLHRMTPGCTLTIKVTDANGTRAFHAKSRIDSPIELDYLRHGGILPYVLRRKAEIADAS